jgi:hypothetical protein
MNNNSIYKVKHFIKIVNANSKTCLIKFNLPISKRDYAILESEFTFKKKNMGELYISKFYDIQI